jgi:hypothetical protein
MEVMDLAALDASLLFEALALCFQPLADLLLGGKNVEQSTVALAVLNRGDSAHLRLQSWDLCISPGKR